LGSADNHQGNSGGLVQSSAEFDKYGGPNEGRWSKFEHCSFLKALKMFGRDWKRVARAVGSRTSTQCRSHAQKFIVSLEKQGMSLEGVLIRQDLMKIGEDGRIEPSDDNLSDQMKNVKFKFKQHPSANNYGSQGSPYDEHNSISNLKPEKSGVKIAEAKSHLAVTPETSGVFKTSKELMSQADKKGKPESCDQSTSQRQSAVPRSDSLQKQEVNRSHTPPQPSLQTPNGKPILT